MRSPRFERPATIRPATIISEAPDEASTDSIRAVLLG
jgi:hypothetical protein